MRARRAGTCAYCAAKIAKGAEIRKGEAGWMHGYCRDAALNAARVNAGLTYAGTPAGYRRKVRRRD